MTGSVATARVCGAADRAMGKSDFPLNLKIWLNVSGGNLAAGTDSGPSEFGPCFIPGFSVPAVKTALALKKK